MYANHLPFIPFPSNWPIFTPAGKLANFLEHYVEILELNVWCESTVDPARTTYNDKSSRWDVTIMRGGLGERTFSVKHIILATGQGGGKPKMPPPFPGQSSFAGRVIHSSQHGTAADWVGKKALVVGACTSAHDICTDFANHGVNVTMLQRSPTFIMSVEHGMGIFGQCTLCSPFPVLTLFLQLADSMAKTSSHSMWPIALARVFLSMSPSSCTSVLCLSSQSSTRTSLSVSRRLASGRSQASTVVASFGSHSTSRVATTTTLVPASA